MEKNQIFLLLLPLLTTAQAQKSSDYYRLRSERLCWEAKFSESLAAADSARVLAGSDIRLRVAAGAAAANCRMTQTRFREAETVFESLQQEAQQLPRCDSLRWYFDVLHANNLHRLNREAEGKALAFALRNSGCQPPDAVSTAAYYEYWATHYGELRQMDTCLYFFQKAATIRNQYAAQDSLQTYIGWRNLGNYYREQGNYDKALQLYQQALEIINRHGNDFQRSKIFHLLSILYDYKGEHTTAFTYGQQALDLVKDLENMPGLYVELTGQLGTLYRSKDYRQAQGYFEKALKYADTHPDAVTKTEYYSLMANRVSAYNAEKDYTSAIRCARTIINDLKPIAGRTIGAPYIVFSAYDVLANAYYLQEDYTHALAIYDTLFQFAAPYFGADHPLLTQPYNNYALAEDGLGNSEKAIRLYNQCLESLHATDNDPFERWENAYIASFVLWNKAASYENWYLREGKNEHLLSAKKYYNRYIEFVDFLRSSYRQEAARQDLSAENRIAYQKGLEMEMRTNPNPAVCFQYMEKSRALKLLDAVRRNRPPEAGITSEIAEKEKILIQKVAEAEAKWLELRSNPVKSDENALQKAQKDIFLAQNVFSSFQKQLQREYPAYFNARYRSTVSTLEETQEQLKVQQTALLEYFIGDTILFIFAANGTQSKVVKVQKDSAFIGLLKRYFEGLTAYYINPRQYETQYEALGRQYAETAYTLYQYLVAPVADILTHKRLVIVPDELTASIPFEALLTKPYSNTTETDFSKLPYWIHQKDISYSPSFTLRSELEKLPVNAQKTLYGIAPTFSRRFSTGKTNEYLGPLPYNKQELLQIAPLFSPTIDTGKQVSKARFLKNCHTPATIHISSHTLINASETCICLAPLPSEKLCIDEVYTLRINADLVVLSACETGTGQFQAGEGVVSLAHAFTYAGAKSMTASLWKVHDASTTQLMRLYYEQLAKKGVNKDIALSAAKRTFINGGDKESAHPFFWAAFITLGQMYAL